jgi:hypothetical protein
LLACRERILAWLFPASGATWSETTILSLTLSCLECLTHSQRKEYVEPLGDSPLSMDCLSRDQRLVTAPLLRSRAAQMGSQSICRGVSKASV